jgi:DNA topoisomerase-2
MVDRGTIMKNFKLLSTISVSNFVLFAPDGKIKKYENELAIIEEFYEVREKGFIMRKEYMLAKLKKECVILQNKMRFILEVID